MISLPSVDASPFASPVMMLGILSMILLTGAIVVALEMRAEAKDKERAKPSKV
ncbi:MAG: hypothetical protein AAF296_12825 [Pseudomonadota bacterium]